MTQADAKTKPLRPSLNDIHLDSGLLMASFLGIYDLASLGQTSRSMRLLSKDATVPALHDGVHDLVYGSDTKKCDWVRADQLLDAQDQKLVEVVALRGLLAAERCFWRRTNAQRLWIQARDCFKQAASKGHWWARVWLAYWLVSDSTKPKLVGRDVLGATQLQQLQVKAFDRRKPDPVALYWYQDFADLKKTGTHTLVQALFLGGTNAKSLCARRYPPVLHDYAYHIRENLVENENKDQGYSLVAEAARQRYPLAMGTLLWYQEHCPDLELDPEKVKQASDKAIELECCAAMTTVCGDRWIGDDSLRKMIHRAAEIGYGGAMYNIAAESGKPREYAREWLTKAAAIGYTRAQKALDRFDHWRVCRNCRDKL